MKDVLVIFDREIKSPISVCSKKEKAIEIILEYCGINSKIIDEKDVRDSEIEFYCTVQTKQFTSNFVVFNFQIDQL